MESEEKEITQANAKIAALSMIAEQYENMSRDAPQENTIQMKIVSQIKRIATLHSALWQGQHVTKSDLKLVVYH